MNISDLFGSVKFGRDNSDRFRLVVDGRMGVKVDDRYVASDGNRLTDVTSAALEGTEDHFFRVPAKKLAKGDLVITAENPWRALFVTRVEKDVVVGLDPWTRQQVNFVGFEVPTMKEPVFVKVVGLDQAMNIEKEFQPLLPALLSQNKEDGDDSNSTLLALLLAGSKRPDNQAMLPLLLSRKRGGDWAAVAAVLATRHEKAEPATDLANEVELAETALKLARIRADQAEAELREIKAKREAEKQPLRPTADEGDGVGKTRGET